MRLPTVRARVLREALTVRAESACHLDAPRSKVWKALIEPGIQLRLDPQVIYAGTVPGTHRGVGEMQFCVRRTNEGTSASVLEVLEFEEGRPPSAGALAPTKRGH